MKATAHSNSVRLIPVTLLLALAAACGPRGGAADGGVDAGLPLRDHAQGVGSGFGTLVDRQILLTALDESHAIGWRDGHLKVWVTDPAALDLAHWELNGPPGAGAPVVDDQGRIYMSGKGMDFAGGGAFTGRAHLIAFDPDGTVRWSFDGGVLQPASSAAVNGDRAYLVLDGALIALDSGVEAWRDSSEGWSSAPLLLGTEVLVASATGAKIFDAAGQALWAAALDQHLGAGLRPMLLANTDTFWVALSGVDGGIYAFDRTARSRRWVHTPAAGGTLGCLCSAGKDGRLFALQTPSTTGGERDLLALGSADGAPLFSVSSAGTFWGATPAADGLGLLATDDGSGLRALDATGQVLWTVPGVQSTPSVRSADRIYALNYTSALALDGAGHIRWSWSPPSSRYSNGVQQRVAPGVSPGGLLLFAWWQNRPPPYNDQSNIMALYDNDH